MYMLSLAFKDRERRHENNYFLCLFGRMRRQLLTTWYGRSSHSPAGLCCLPSGTARGPVCRGPHRGIKLCFPLTSTRIWGGLSDFYFFFTFWWALLCFFSLQNESELFGRTIRVNLAKPMRIKEGSSRPGELVPGRGECPRGTFRAPRISLSAIPDPEAEISALPPVWDLGDLSSNLIIK